MGSEEPAILPEHHAASAEEAKLEPKKRKRAPLGAEAKQLYPKAPSKLPAREAEAKQKTKEKAPSSAEEAKLEPKKRKREAEPKPKSVREREWHKQRYQNQKAAGGEENYREQRQEAKDKAPPLTEAQQKQREYGNQKMSEHKARVAAAGGEENYRKQRQEAKEKACAQALVDRELRAEKKRKAQLNPKKRFQDDLPTAQNMAQAVQEALRNAGMFALCLSSLHAAAKGELWRSVLQCAELVDPDKIFYIDVEGKREG